MENSYREFQKATDKVQEQNEEIQIPAEAADVQPHERTKVERGTPSSLSRKSHKDETIRNIIHLRKLLIFRMRLG